MFLAIAAAALPLQAQAQPPARPAPRIVAPATPRAPPQAYIGAEDYPASLQRGEQGAVGFILDVGANGRVAGCTIRRSSGYGALDSATCRLMRSRARFTPAMDSTGSAVPSRVTQEVLWVAPGSPLAPARNWGGGMMVAHVAPPPVAVYAGPPVVNPPIMAIPQDGPGEADLSHWDSRTGALADLGRYPSIPACRKVKDQLRLRSDQRAWCTVAPENAPPPR
jgi:TonB family protein